MEALLKLPEVKRRVGLSKTDIYIMMSANRFPRNVKISIRSVAWVESEIENWVQQKIAKSRPQNKDSLVV
jgi:prophage regulatory protein